MGKRIEDYDFFKQLAAHPCVEAIWLFGSRARGDNQERADIDLALVCPSASIRDWDALLQITEEADTLLSIDCIRFDTLQEDSPLKKAILSQGIKLYERL